VVAVVACAVAYYVVASCLTIDSFSEDDECNLGTMRRGWSGWVSSRRSASTAP
jgi:hypothetical protein